MPKKSSIEYSEEPLTIDLNPKAPQLPKVLDKTKIDIRYMLISPYVSVHIYWNKQISEVCYEIEEPKITEQEREILMQIEKGMRELVNVNLLVEKDLTAVLKYLEQTSRLVIAELGIKIKNELYKRFFYYLYRDFVGLNEAEPMLRDFFIEDIECNGVNSPVYIVHRIYRNMRTSVVFKDLDYLAGFVEKLAQRCGKYISYASPLLDGSLPDGSRVNATYTTEISSKGPTFTIRKFTKIPLTPIQLISFNTLSPEMLAYLWILMQYKSSILITGGTASGKTSLLNAIAFFIPPEARVVSIEDTRELNLPRENWLPSVTRTGIGIGGAGEIDLFTLLKESFRQNPDYVIVGEVRGAEASVLFQGMASGHAGMSTMHAESVDTVIRRLQTPPINLPPTLVNSLDAVAIMSHAIVNRQETRRLTSIVEVIEVTPDGVAKTNTPFTWDAATDRFYFKTESKVFEKIMRRYGLTREELVREFNLRTKLIYELYKRKVFDFDIVQSIVNNYYKNQNAILKEYGIVA